MPLLRSNFNDPNPRIRGGSAVALSYILQVYASVYGASPSGGLEAHPWMYWKGPPTGDVILDVARALNSVDRDALPQTLFNLCNIGPSAKVAISYVLPMLKDPDGQVRLNALWYLKAMGPAARVSVPDVIQRLNDERAIRLKAMEVLGECGPAAKDAIPDLAIALKSTDSEISEQAALALANIDPGHKGILPIVKRTLNESGKTESAIKALAEMGSSARPAIPALEHLIATDHQASERRAAVKALPRINGANAVPTLERAMRGDKDESVRTAAVTALGKLGSSSGRAISALVGAFSNDSEAVREAASEALRKLGSSAVPGLIAALKSPDLYQRAWAVQTLSRIKPLPDDAAHALTLALNDNSEIVRAEAAAALKGNKVDAREAIRDQQMKEDLDVAQATDQGLASFEAGQTPQDTRRYTKAELIAPIPPDKNHEYPSQLKYFVPVAPSQDGMDRLAVWKKTGDDKYERLLVQQASSENHLDEPTVFSSKVLVTGQGSEHYETALFVDLPLHSYWGDGEGVYDTVFVVDRDELRAVQIQKADEWYAKNLRPGEWTWISLSNSFSDNDLEFGFLIWETMSRLPRGAEVNGTHKIIKKMHYDAQKHYWVPNWKMVVNTAKREPRPER